MVKIQKEFLLKKCRITVNITIENIEVEGGSEAQLGLPQVWLLRDIQLQNPKDRLGQDGHDELAETQAFIERLTEEERMLIVLQRELYDGSWSAMQKDLENRLEGKPYIFKLANRIHDDVERIERLKEFEEKHNILLREVI